MGSDQYPDVDANGQKDTAAQASLRTYLLLGDAEPVQLLIETLWRFLVVRC